MAGTIIALDIGERRIGVARASLEANIPEPLVTLPNNDDFPEVLSKLITEHGVSQIIIGLPRGLDGQETAQTKYVRLFANSLKLSIPVRFQDEAGTSVAAREILQASTNSYNKGDVDAMAATIILNDYLLELKDKQLASREQ